MSGSLQRYGFFFQKLSQLFPLHSCLLLKKSLSATAGATSKLRCRVHLWQCHQCSRIIKDVALESEQCKYIACQLSPDMLFSSRPEDNVAMSFSRRLYNVSLHVAGKRSGTFRPISHHRLHMYAKRHIPTNQPSQATYVCKAFAPWLRSLYASLRLLCYHATCIRLAHLVPYNSSRTR
jgi:hypothetical protein